MALGVGLDVWLVQELADTEEGFRVVSRVVLVDLERLVEDLRE